MTSLLLTREAILAEMGIRPLWQLKTGGSSTGNSPIDSSEISDQRVVDTVCEFAIDDTAEATVLVTERDIPSGQISPSPLYDPQDWTDLSAAVNNCKACVLCERRNRAVLGVGDLHPEWLFIGEGPGAEEDARGEPFVGQAGRLLDNMLQALGLKRGTGVYIANAVKCRPPGNRTPEAAEMAACFPFLEQQIAMLKPKIIVLLGRAAVHSVLKEDKALSRMRQQCFSYAGIPVVVTYHPAYLLRNLMDKAKAWEDLLFAQRCLRGELS